MKLHLRCCPSPLVFIAGFVLVLADPLLADNFSNLYNFTALAPIYSTNSDGAIPDAELTLSDNTLYGTATEGGISGLGTVFKIKTDGTDFVTLHSFGCAIEGADPVAGLVSAGNTLYGTAPH